MAGKVTSKVENERTLVLERNFDAPPSLVFEMYKKPEHLTNWWGPRGWELPVCKMDFRVGGTWLYCMKCVDKSQGNFFGMEAWGKAVYENIVEGKRIDYVDYFCDANGVVNDQLPSTKAKTELIDMGGKTKLISRAEYATPEALKTVLDMGMIDGISQTWDRLDDYLRTKM